MNISHIEHVGIAVTSLEEAIPFYENMLGFKCFAIEEVASRSNRSRERYCQVYREERWPRRHPARCICC